MCVSFMSCNFLIIGFYSMFFSSHCDQAIPLQLPRLSISNKPRYFFFLLRLIIEKNLRIFVTHLCSIVKLSNSGTAHQCSSGTSVIKICEKYTKAT